MFYSDTLTTHLWKFQPNRFSSFNVINRKTHIHTDITQFLNYISIHLHIFYDKLLTLLFINQMVCKLKHFKM